LFFIIWSLSFSLFLYPAVKTVSRFGTKHSMIVSIPFMIISIGLILSLQYYPNLFWVAALFYGGEFAFFWMGFNIDAALEGKKKDFGKESGVISFLGLLPGIIGPILGGLVLYFFSFNFLYIFAMFFVLISFVPLLLSKEVYSKSNLHLKFDKKHLKYSVGYFAEGVSNMTGLVFWPLFIFSILGSYLTLGSYGTVVTTIVGLFTLAFGKWSDEGKRRLLLRLFSFIFSIVWFLKIFVVNVVGVFTLGIFSNIAGYGVYVPMLAKSFSMTRKEKVSYMFFRELSLGLGRIVALLLVLITVNLKVGFILSAVVWMVLFFLIR